MQRGRLRLVLAALAIVLGMVFVAWRGGAADPGGRLPAPDGAASAATAAGGAASPPAGSGALGGSDARSGGHAAKRADDAALPPEMRQQLADIARAYAENSRYPAYATPLSAQDWAQLNPRAFVPRRAALEGVPGVSAALVLERYLVDRDRELPVRVVLASAAPDAAAGVSAVRVWLRQAGRRSAPLTLAPGGDAAFAGVLPVTALQAVAAGEVVVVAELDLASGERATVTAMVRAYDSAARLLGLGEARVDGADLVIPARFEVAAAGYYRVQANLFTADGQQPVSHLNAEFPLAAGPAGAVLKVHAVTLRAAGPYLLRDIDITRLPDRPGEATGYGSAAAATFAVRGFPLAAYSNEPWDDPAARQRLEFLQKLGGGPAPPG